MPLFFRRFYVTRAAAARKARRRSAEDFIAASASAPAWIDHAPDMLVFNAGSFWQSAPLFHGETVGH
ncbi:protein of unknown function [Methylocella tundrae]|uniref:Uncharacterized protein n=1 Tax=Methylocella tundrae TaxID=227605 RepID=A0A4U8Z4V4_METTU|nr:protein of unknown function [Methylocella tundrae]